MYPLRFYSAQLVLALEYLHHVGVVYRDLVPDNVTVDGSGYLKLWWLLRQEPWENVQCELQLVQAVEGAAWRGEDVLVLRGHHPRVPGARGHPAVPGAHTRRGLVSTARLSRSKGSLEMLH